MTIKFQKYYVTDGKVKAKIWYALDNRIDGRKCVTIYEKDYSGNLGKVFPADFRNETNMTTDYFEKDRVVLFENHPLYSVARARATAN